MATTTAQRPVLQETSMLDDIATDVPQVGILPSQAVRLAARNGTHTGPTSGYAPGYLQANLIVVPSKHASDFRQLCFRNPVPCPLLAESAAPGSYDCFKSYIPGVADGELFTGSIDIRTDIPRYNVYQNGKVLQSGCTSIEDVWTEDSIAFLIGCSFSFETALTEQGLMPNHVRRMRNVPMYRTNIPLNASGVFHSSTYIVSMRSYLAKDIDKVRDLTRPFLWTHGEPIDWGWDAPGRLGIKDVDKVDFGSPPLCYDGGLLARSDCEANEGEPPASHRETPIFWGCGVTPQEAVMKAGARIDGMVMAHLPGHMLLLDVTDAQIRKT